VIQLLSSGSNLKRKHFVDRLRLSSLPRLKKMHPPPSIVSSFVTLLVTIGPVETAVVFASLTAGTRRGERRRLALRSTSIAGLGLLLFAICGNVTLGLLHISLPAFRVAGGLLLFLQALSLTFSGPGLSSISEGERHDAERPGDIAVFPLAFPLIAGPGGLSAAVLLMGRTDGWIEALGVIAMIVVCLGLTYGAVRAAERLVTLLGVTGADVVRRISGVLLSGLAIQFVFDGLERAPFLP
jgi:multiple antibiotic resistance protein